jgi:hypothetical protein
VSSDSRVDVAVWGVPLYVCLQCSHAAPALMPGIDVSFRQGAHHQAGKPCHVWLCVMPAVLMPACGCFKVALCWGRPWHQTGKLAGSQKAVMQCFTC